MGGRDFHVRALSEAQRYGEDAYVFLRELAQNARDAGAARIEVTTGADAGGEWVCFDDDGVGMTFEHARAYLFRLYASSKEGDATAAGRFGVGFWSILRFEPEAILVESRAGDEVWAVVLDAGLTEFRSVRPAKSGHGTRITLRRSSRSSPPELAVEVEGALRRYCRFLRRARGGSLPLPTSSNGVPINEPMRLPGATSLAFATRDAEGVVGLASEPRVELYARGLLVTTATLLEELQPGGDAAGHARRVGGLAPVVLVNSNGLDLVLSRRAPKRSRALRRIVRLARGRLRRLVAHVAEGAYPRTWRERLQDEALRLGRVAGPAGTVAIAVGLLMLLGVGAGAGYLATRTGSSRSVARVEADGGRAGAAYAGVSWERAGSGLLTHSPSVEETAAAAPAPGPLPYSSLSGYAGATVEVPDAAASPWDLSYDGPRDLLLRALTLDQYDSRHGWMPGPASPLTDYPRVTCRRDCVRVRLRVLAQEEPLVVPVPTGHAVDSATIEFAGEAVVALWANPQGDAVVMLPPGRSGLLEYATSPFSGPAPRAGGLPGVQLPASLSQTVQRVRRLQPARRVDRIAALVRRRIAYDVSPATARAFAAARGDWLGRVLRLEAGDCDVKNGLNVLLLLEAGVPARMAIGIAGHQGHARPHLHAWTEYYLNGWRVVDATGPVRAPVASSRPVVAASVEAAEARRAPSARAAPPQGRASSGSPTMAASASPLPASPGASGAAQASPQPASARVPAKSPGPVHSRQSAVGSPLICRGSLSTIGCQLPTAEDSVRGPAASAVGNDAGRGSLGTRVAESPRPRPAVLLAMFLAAVLAGLIVIWRHRSSRERLLARGDQAAQRDLLARMLHDALMRPRGWRSVANLWHCRVLPTLAGRPLSVAEALERAGDGALFVSWRRSELARLAAARGTPVLDGTDAIFRRVIAILGRTLDLDAVDRLRPVAEEEPHDARAIAALAPVNQLLRRAGAAECRICPGLEEAAVLDVDLSAARLPPGAAWPRRYVAVSPAHPEVHRRLELLARDPGRGLFVWLDWLLDHSELLAPGAAAIRERAALAVVEGLAVPPAAKAAL